MDITRESWNRTQDEIAKLRRQIDDQYFRSGDSLQLNLVAVNGFITNNAKNIHVTVNTGKSMKNISSITVTTMTGSIIGDMGYVDNSNSRRDWLASGFTATATIIDEYTIRLTLTGSEAMANVTNNRPVAYYPSNSTVGGLVLTFGG